MSDPRPGWMINAQSPGIEEQSLTIYGARHMFTVVVSGIVPELPYIVGRTKEGFLFISDDVPEAYWPHIIAHELREEMNLTEIPREELCVLSLREELLGVDEDETIDLNTYVRERGRFFDALVPFYENNPEQLAARPPGFLDSIRRSQELLRSLLS